MLDDNIIRKSKSPWSFPVVLSLKADGTWRFCVDYSKLTDKVSSDPFPLPRKDDTIDKLGNSKWFTTLDLASGYWQIPIKEADEEKLAFSTPGGHFEFIVMPFGFTNASAVFQRAI